jgi:catecholate siderophore receptor
MEKNKSAAEFRGGIRSVARKPLGQAAIGVASMVLMGSASAQDRPTDIPAIDVNSGANGTGSGYEASANAGSTRFPVPLVNTPQTVNVVTQQVIQDQGATSVRDALRNVSGVTFRAGEGGNQGDTPYIRGFSAQNDIFRDQVRDPGFYTRDIFSIDAVEVYKGPTSFLFGRGSTGGVINLVSKTPVDRTFLDAYVTGNTGPGWRTSVDVNGKASENVTGRLVVMGQGYNTPGRDNVEENRVGVAPSIKFQVSDKTTATFSYIYQRERSVPDYGIPYLKITDGYPRRVAPVSRNNWYGILTQPYADVLNDDVHIGTARIEHRFSDNLKITNTTRYEDVNHFQRNVFPEPNASVPDLSNLNVNWTPNRAQVAVNNRLAVNQTDILAKFNTGTLEHTVAAGFDATQENRDFTRNAFSGMGATNFLDPNEWRAPGIPVAPNATQYTNGESTDVGAFAADQVKLNQWWEVLGGLRYERFKFSQEQPIQAPGLRNLESTNYLLSWRAGIVFHPTSNTSIYAMHGTSFNPSADNLTVTTANVNLQPEKNITTEIGAKAEVLGNRMLLQTAVFKTEKTNMRVTNPADLTTMILGGKIEAPGFEASATGRITEKWQLIASYTYTHARITQTSQPQIAQLNNAPLNSSDNSFSLWTTYDVTQQWQVGAGAFYTGNAWADLPNSALIPAYWRFDAMAAYKVTPKSTIQFNIYNLTNEYYAASAYSNWYVPGPSRYAALTYRTSW